MPPSSLYPQERAANTNQFLPSASPSNSNSLGGYASTPKDAGILAPRETEVVREINRLTRLIQESAMYFEILCGSISPILSSATPTKDDGTNSTKAPTMTEVGNTLSELGDRVSRLNRNMNEVSLRVQL